jgi:hypothetical protein
MYWTMLLELLLGDLWFVGLFCNRFIFIGVPWSAARCITEAGPVLVLAKLGK